ncbi:18.1 kDa class I heat shock protein-like [Diospyros lotus]|uniref:18.1 kDa class I heat shock protein-like n=1 Tax=Diospyros lotus TaxID=55363 RepID=UPI0022591BD8|nr:18.1 kDa class I heat shock protein-like [Diospyros lotus]
MSIIPPFGPRRTSPFPFNFRDPFKYSPFQNTFFGAGHGALFPGGEGSELTRPHIDWEETPEAHVFKVDLPGLRKEEVRVQVEGDRVLKISGERALEMVDWDDRWHRVERRSGQFLRRFRLPEDARVDQVKATMHDGVLVVTIPKGEVKKSRVKTVHFI